jgi:hypothetical protein
MHSSADAVLDRVKVREVTGVFHSREALDAQVSDMREALDATVSDLLLAGFDRADIDLMASADAVQQKLGTIYVATEELPDVPQVPRRAFIARDDLTLITATAAGMLTFIGATAAALSVVASGGALALAVAAATAGGTAGGIGGLMFGRFLGKKEASILEEHLARGGLILWVRVRTSEQEAEAIKVLQQHNAKAVRVHEIDLEKRLEDLPLSSVKPDPWLGDERLGQV